MRQRSGNGSARSSVTWKTALSSLHGWGVPPPNGQRKPPRSFPEQRANLYRAATLFNEVWYGDHEATAEGYRLVCTLDDALRTTLPAMPSESAS